MFTPAQLRAARALLGWSQQDLAKASGVHINSINAFENGLSDPKQSTLIKLRGTLFRAGIIFIDADSIAGTGAGVKFMWIDPKNPPKD